MEKIITILATIWTGLLSLVDKLLISLSTMSIMDLLKWLIVLIVIMIFVLGFLSATASVVNHSLAVIRRLFRYLTVIAGILIVVFWVFAAERPCMFNAESAVTSCLKKDAWEKRQKALDK